MTVESLKSTEPDIRTTPEIRIIGLKLDMSLANNRVAELWQSFMPKRHLINTVSPEMMYSIAEYDEGYFNAFNPTTSFTRWAGLAVSEHEPVPEGFNEIRLGAGKYAVFTHYGAGPTARQTFMHIHGNWMPKSGYGYDNRPFFELLGPKYKNNDPSSEEEIWVPIV
ncbi:MAG: AraC family transcriptional regulator [Bacteroidetes bacterium]|nr:AraC family transcriptional regulator [Bacteroidota bacterium]